jgi:SPP1 family predicted phage head-tail adaptor
MRAGGLRHRVTIQALSLVQDPESGEMITDWVDVWTKVPARFEYLNGRELLAAQAVQSEVTARITIRHRPGVLATMRGIYRGEIWNFTKPLPDNDSGLESLVIPVSAGVNDG